MNSKRNLFVFVALILGGIYLIYFFAAVMPAAMKNPEILSELMLYAPHIIFLTIGVVLNFLCYRKYVAKKMLIAAIMYTLSLVSSVVMTLLTGVILGGAFMVLPAVITSFLAVFLKINQNSSKFVGE